MLILLLLTAIVKGNDIILEKKATYPSKYFRESFCLGSKVFVSGQGKQVAVCSNVLRMLVGVGSEFILLRFVKC